MKEKGKEKKSVTSDAHTQISKGFSVEVCERVLKSISICSFEQCCLFTFVEVSTRSVELRRGLEMFTKCRKESHTMKSFCKTISIVHSKIEKKRQQTK